MEERRAFNHAGLQHRLYKQQTYSYITFIKTLLVLGKQDAVVGTKRIKGESPKNIQ